MFDPLVEELSQRYGLGDRGRDLFGLLLAYIHNDRRGGFGGFVEGFREQGQGELLSSWLGDPEAGGLTASDVGTVFGQGLLSDWAGRLGVSRATLAAAIAGVLPRLVAELTPGGRIPGGFAPVAPHDAPHARRERPLPAVSPAAGLRDPVADPPPRDADSFSVRPGVEGLIFEGEREVDSSDRGPDSAGRVGPLSQSVSRAADDDAPDAPAYDPATTPLRREAVFAPESNAVRTPVEARRDQHALALPTTAAAPPVLDAGEQRIADMAAAFEPAGSTAAAAMPLTAEDRRPDSWRPAVHPPRRRGGRGWLMLLLVLAVLAAAGWYAWSIGLLDPYIRQFNLAIPVSQVPDGR